MMNVITSCIPVDTGLFFVAGVKMQILEVTMKPGSAVTTAIATVLLIAGTLMIPPGCSFSRDRDDALRETDRWFELVRQGKYRESAELLAPSFLESTPRERYIAMLATLKNGCGELGQQNLRSWSSQSKASPGGEKSSLVVLVFDVPCPNGALIIKLTCTRSGSDKSPRILLMSITGSPMQQEEQKGAPPREKEPEGVMI
jgi:hypothetical protein